MSPDFLRSVIADQTRLLDALIERLSNVPPDQAESTETAKVIVLMILAQGATKHSVLKLTEQPDMAIRDCYGMARSAFELAINTCYIAASDQDVRKRAVQHATQKFYRDFERTTKIGDFEIRLSSGAQPDIDAIDGLKEALEEFSKNGREITDWTPLNISRRIAAISNFDPGAGVALGGALMAVYRHASELLHGTYFGVLYFWSVDGQPPRGKDHFNEQWLTHFTAIFVALFFSASAIIRVCARRFNYPDLISLEAALMRQVKSSFDAERDKDMSRPAG